MTEKLVHPFALVQGCYFLLQNIAQNLLLDSVRKKHAVICFLQIISIINIYNIFDLNSSYISEVRVTENYPPWKITPVVNYSRKIAPRKITSGDW